MERLTKRIARKKVHEQILRSRLKQLVMQMCVHLIGINKDCLGPSSNLYSTNQTKLKFPEGITESHGNVSKLNGKNNITDFEHLDKNEIFRLSHNSISIPQSMNSSHYQCPMKANFLESLIEARNVLRNGLQTRGKTPDMKGNSEEKPNEDGVSSPLKVNTAKQIVMPVVTNPLESCAT